MRKSALFSLIVLGLALPAAGMQIPAADYAERRARLLEKFSDGMTLIHARPSPASLGEHRFRQDTTFFYFTGLGNQPAAILVLDGPRNESLLFVPPAPTAFGAPVKGVSLEPGEASARAHGLNRVEDWDRFVPYVEKRLSEGVKKLYLDDSRQLEMAGNPESLWPIAGEKILWRRSVEHAFPEAEIDSIRSVVQEMRWVKSPAEVEILREVARTTVAALLDGIHAVGPGKSQKESEAAVVCGCIAAGASGPSFWPWTMAGPNAHLGRVVNALYEYEHLNRTMQPGELVRMDTGCELGHYEGDVGRTVPVSGRFNEDQRETWNMFIGAYKVGLSSMKAGATLPAVMEEAKKEIGRRQGSLQSEYARRAAATILQAPLRASWHIHGVGLDGGETGTDTLENGSVIAFEPMFSVDDDAYYLEDMILITEDGHEILSRGLPYTAEEIEAVMNR